MIRIVLAAVVLAAAPAARAEDAVPAAATAPAPAQPEATAPAPVRVRASHRVDVIAPGERVETVIDRLRAAAPGAVGGAAAAGQDRRGAPARSQARSDADGRRLDDAEGTAGHGMPDRRGDGLAPRGGPGPGAPGAGAAPMDRPRR